MTTSGHYNHCQRGLLHWLSFAIALALLLVAFAVPVPAEVRMTLLTAALLLIFAALSFASLTVSDCGERLRAAFGPLPLFRVSISYADIASVNVTKNRLIDGWGLQYVPFRGWTCNIHGWDCVELSRNNGRILRIGTDEPEKLAEFIRRRLSHL